MSYSVDIKVKLRQSQVEALKDFYDRMVEDAQQSWMDDAGRFWAKRLKKNFAFSFDPEAGYVRIQTNEPYAEALGLDRPFTRWINGKFWKVFFNQLSLDTINDDFLNKIKGLSNGVAPDSLQVGSPVKISGYNKTYLKYLSEVYQVFLTAKVLKHEFAPRPIVLEIGAGVGMLGVILRQLFAQSTYVVVDLPFTAMISSTFLSSLFPGHNFLFYDGKEITREDLEKADFVFLPNYAIQLLPKDCCDLIWNLASMGEMTQGIVEGYFADIRRLIKPEGLFYNSNRYTKSTDFMNYPYLPGDKHLFRGFKPASMVPHLVWKPIHSKIPFKFPKFKMGHARLFLTWISQMQKPD